jgi:hypothetical protein
MYVPITSEVTIKTGMVLRRIATNELYTVSERLGQTKEVSGQDAWKITPITTDPYPMDIILPRQVLSEKYFAEVDD